ncbi:cyclic 3',5'-adenosine monophosphate phosphodiesterase, partial [Salmonella enterica subsp. enterica serovar Enteritidis str. 76-2651]
WRSLWGKPPAGYALKRRRTISPGMRWLTRSEKHETLLGVNTWESYQAVLEAIRAQQYEYDLIVATG